MPSGGLHAEHGELGAELLRWGHVGQAGRLGWVVVSVEEWELAVGAGGALGAVQLGQLQHQVALVGSAGDAGQGAARGRAPGWKGEFSDTPSW